ncbi:TonB-dependent receptor [Bacteroides ovatus]|nr:TonB-dependent receptor [Bacteroides ovatus]
MSQYAFLSTYNLMEGNKNAYQTIPEWEKVMQALRAFVIANPTLTLENTLTYNAGFDFTMWNGLLGMEFDAFYNYTYDILTAMEAITPIYGRILLYLCQL